MANLKFEISETETKEGGGEILRLCYAAKAPDVHDFRRQSVPTEIARPISDRADAGTRRSE
jgi:hypothetical protein